MGYNILDVHSELSLILMGCLLFVSEVVVGVMVALCMN